MSDREILKKSLGKVVQKPSVDVAIRVFEDLPKPTQYSLLAKHKIPSSEVSTTQKLKKTLQRNGRFLIAVTLVATSGVLLHLAHKHKIINEETIQEVVKQFNDLGNDCWKHVKTSVERYSASIKDFFYGTPMSTALVPAKKQPTHTALVLAKKQPTHTVRLTPREKYQKMFANPALGEIIHV